jgi:hypothetical protein
MVERDVDVLAGQDEMKDAVGGVLHPEAQPAARGVLDQRRVTVQLVTVVALVLPVCVDLPVPVIVEPEPVAGVDRELAPQVLQPVGSDQLLHRRQPRGQSGGGNRGCDGSLSEASRSASGMGLVTTS